MRPTLISSEPAAQAPGRFMEVASVLPTTAAVVVRMKSRLDAAPLGSVVLVITCLVTKKRCRQSERWRLDPGAKSGLTTYYLSLALSNSRTTRKPTNVASVCHQTLLGF